MDDEIIEALHERPLWHPSIKKEHAIDDCHTTQESTSQADDEIEEDWPINDPKYTDETSSHSESMNLEDEECLE